MNEVTWEHRECVSTEVADLLGVLGLETIQHHLLNRTAGAVWVELATPKSTSTIVSTLRGRFNVSPGTCGDSVSRLLEHFEQRNRVRRVDEVTKLLEHA